MLRTANDCYYKGEERAAARLEKMMERQLKNAQKRRDKLEVSEGIFGANYQCAAMEYLAMQHWRNTVIRLCDYRRMQLEELKKKRRERR